MHPSNHQYLLRFIEIFYILLILEAAFIEAFLFLQTNQMVEVLFKCWVVTTCYHLIFKETVCSLRNYHPEATISAEEHQIWNLIFRIFFEL